MNNKKTILLILIVLTIILTIFNFLLDKFALHRVEVENARIIERVVSPSQEYEVVAYLIEGDALVRESILVQLKTDNKTKNIFYDYPIREVKMKWVDENTVEINEIILDVRTDTYDWRWN